MAGLSVGSFLTSGAQASTITWGAATAISGSADVSTAGTLDRAFNFGDVGIAGTNVNGVTFNPFAGDNVSPSITVGNTTVSAIGGNSVVQGNTGAFGVPAYQFATLPSAYQNLLNSGVYDGHGDLQLTLNGLTAGNTYLLQLFVNDSRQGYQARSEAVTDGPNTVILNYNTGNIDGGLGQFVTGTFVADSTSKTISLIGLSTDPFYYNTAQLDGLQLRVTDTAAAAAPLPSSAFGGLVLLGALGYMKLRRPAVK